MHYILKIAFVFAWLSAGFYPLRGIGRVSGFLALSLSVCVVLFPLAGEAPAQSPSTSSATPALDEPITPIPSPPAADPRKLALGESLFADRRLSHDGRLACSSCHDIRTNGALSRVSGTANAGAKMAFDTPTVFNAALSFRLNWEGNQRSLQSQAEASLKDPGGMAAGMDEVLDRLKAASDVASRFNEAYGHPPDRASLLDALEIYEESLVTPGSRFDRWLSGEAAQLSPNEQYGYRLFKSLGCASCHQGVNIGGNLFERVGIFRPLTSTQPRLLRVPSLRNIATTPPYFHDGSAPTLDDAVRRMALAQLDQRLPDVQVDAIVAFLNTLTGTYRGVPVTGPAP
ncbi:cytochrome-c peroxidase [Labrys monachus]|uniref:Cytochrome c peroxidase n=1 Tax=Labrys monachus TaxID=217067 RepID=A0ABU0FC05_9HYPH|nr:cytochrome c peroxidase [Labrys monachus]MDQ0392139.1 cytochrome c peroxidase [Labrys monachus]